MNAGSGNGEQQWIYSAHEIKLTTKYCKHDFPGILENSKLQQQQQQQQKINTSFLLTSSIARQKYHNNFLSLVRVGLNLVGFAREYYIDGRFDRFHSWKVFFPLLISNLCRKDMKHFVTGKKK